MIDERISAYSVESLETGRGRTRKTDIQRTLAFGIRSTAGTVIVCPNTSTNARPSAPAGFTTVTGNTMIADPDPG